MPTRRSCSAAAATWGFRQLALLVSVLNFRPQPFKLSSMKPKIGLFQASLLCAANLASRKNS
jgi:hypothetical protein